MPTFDSVQLVRDVVLERAAGKNAAFFQGIEAEWCQRVQQYIDASGIPPTVTRWAQIAHKADSFKNLYLHPAEGSVQGEMLRVLREYILNICPACGELGRPNTLDHYLPKSLYPHLSITPHNLYPMCDACQLAKDNLVGDYVSPRYFIHPYFDSFLANQLLFLEFQGPYNAPTYSLNIVDTIDPEYIDIIVTHVRHLKIRDRYVKFFKGQHSILLRSVKLLRDSQQDVLQSLINRRNEAAFHSLNAWEHIYYSGIINNHEFIDYLTNGELPPLP